MIEIQISILSSLDRISGSRSLWNFADLLALNTMGWVIDPPISYSSSNKGKDPARQPNIKSVIHLVLLLPSIVMNVYPFFNKSSKNL